MPVPSWSAMRCIHCSYMLPAVRAWLTAALSHRGRRLLTSSLRGPSQRFRQQMMRAPHSQQMREHPQPLVAQQRREQVHPQPLRVQQQPCPLCCPSFFLSCAMAARVCFVWSPGEERYGLAHSRLGQCGDGTNLFSLRGLFLRLFWGVMLFSLCFHATPPVVLTIPPINALVLNISQANKGGNRRPCGASETAGDPAAPCTTRLCNIPCPTS